MSSYYEKMLATGEVKCIDEEVPFNVPQGWEWERFGNVMINKDSERVPLSVAQRQHLKKTYDYYGASGVIDKVDKYLFDKDLLLIGEDGANLINRSTPIAFIAKGKFWVNNHAHVLDVCSGMALSYVALFINAISLVDYVTGTAQPKMNQEKMNSILLAIPPVKEQHRILEKMSMVDAFIDKYASLQIKLNSLDNSVYELLRKSILQEAIQGKLVPQITEEGAAQELLEQIKAEKQELVKEGKLKKSTLNDSVIFRGDDNKYWEKNGKNVVCIDKEIPFEIPNNWNWCRLKDIGKTETGTTPSKLHPEYFGNYIPFLSPANIFGSKIISETQGLSNIGVQFGRVVPKNSILQVCIGGSIGKCAIVNKPTTFNQQINSITPYFCNVEFVHIVLQSEYFRLAIIDKATGTATPIINRGNWETLLFPLPPLKEQQRIIEKYKGVTSIMSR